MQPWWVLIRNVVIAAALRREYLRGERDGWEANRDDYDQDDDAGCVLGAECCCPHPFHSSSECYSAEWAEEYFASTDESP